MRKDFIKERMHANVKYIYTLYMHCANTPVYKTALQENDSASKLTHSILTAGVTPKGKEEKAKHLCININWWFPMTSEVHDINTITSLGWVLEINNICLEVFKLTSNHCS